MSFLNDFGTTTKKKKIIQIIAELVALNGKYKLYNKSSDSKELKQKQLQPELKQNSEKEPATLIVILTLKTTTRGDARPPHCIRVSHIGLLAKAMK